MKVPSSLSLVAWPNLHFAGVHDHHLTCSMMQGNDKFTNAQQLISTYKRAQFLLLFFGNNRSTVRSPRKESHEIIKLLSNANDLHVISNLKKKV